MTTGLRMFRRHRPAALLVMLAAAVALAGCTAPDAPEATPAPTAPASASPTSTPTPAPVAVAGGEKPPTVFDADCERMIPSATVGEIIGFPVTVRDRDTATSVANMGGLNCDWEGEGGVIRAAAIPRAALGETEFPPDQVLYYFEQCDPGWVCAWRGEAEGLWTSVSFQLRTGMTREAVDAWGEAMGEAIAANFAASDHPAWQRDDAGWWPVLDCTRVADRLGTELGISVTGQAVGSPDPPSPEVVIAGRASHESQCYVTLDSTEVPLELFTAAGQGWAFPSLSGGQAYDTGIQGVTAYVQPGDESNVFEGYSLTDGVNTATAYVPTDGAVSADEIVRALAVIAADGWR